MRRQEKRRGFLQIVEAGGGRLIREFRGRALRTRPGLNMDGED